MARRLALALLLAGVVAAPARADDPELITVTTTRAIATWDTAAPADTTICWGRRAPDEHCAVQEQGVTEHYATMRRLRPRTSYVYELRSGGRTELPTPANPGRFTTLTRPPGRHLLDFALINDLHVGEGCAGTAVNEPLLGTSIPPCFSAPQYAERMDEAVVEEIARRHVRVTLVNGDVTAEARPAEVARAREILSRLPGLVLVARGNHDRVHADRPECPQDDCFRAAFHPDRPPGRIYGSATRRGVHFAYLDSVGSSTSTGDLTDPAQNAWLARDLATHRSQRTFVFFHHPASEYADAFEAEPVIFGVPPTQGGTQFLHTVAENPQIVGVLQAHTHRNFDSYALEAGARTPFVENGTSKEYPGGYSIFSVYRGGYTRSYFRPRDCAFCRAWTRTTRGEYFGLAPQYLLGSLGTRNFSHVYGCPVAIPAPSLPGHESLLTGGIVSPPRRCLRR
jgi:hypothetical protein